MSYDKDSYDVDNSMPRGFTRNGITQFKDRLKQAMGNESGNSFAKRCGISEASVRAYLSGKTYPSLDKLAVLAEKCEVPISWLANGDNEGNSMNRNIVPEHVTEAQEKVWQEFLHRMTPIERDSIIDSVVRKGLSVLLQSAQRIDTTDASSVSSQAMAVARTFEALTPEEQKSFLESVEKEKQTKASLDNGSKNKAS
ncbi:helix-turn-helix domain-containing protein [Morganella morganii]|uniref:helix-turn-helix domain-containing protein n=1 Tax=Morganella morganii TaxID=582 RepID=UPI0032DACB1A